MRTSDELWGNDIKAKALPDEAGDTAAPSKAESSPAPKQETQASEQQPATKAEAKPAETHEDEEDAHVPDDLSGLKRALAAARGDKRKARKQWQETEKRLAELSGRMSAMHQQPRADAPKPPSPEDDFYANPVAAMQRQAAQLRREMSVEMMRSVREDYDQVVSEFARKIQGTPIATQIEAQLSNHPNPARFVYDYAKNFAKLEGVSSIDDFEKKVEERVRARLEAEYAERQQPVNTRPIPKPSLAGARGNGAGAPQNWAGPRSFDELW
jgi:hypothetical protein